MNAFLQRQVLSFGCAALLTAAVWYACWPQRLPVASARSHAEPSPQEPKSKNWQEAVAQTASAEGNEARLAAAVRLGEVPTAEIPALLDSIELVKDRQLTLAAKTLLIRWASEDGKAAAEWSWLKFRADGMWYFVLLEIAGAWAWRDPEGLAKWTMEIVAQQGPGFQDSLSVEEVLKRDVPVIERGRGAKICELLIRQSPRWAFELFLKLPGWSTGDGFMTSSLQSPEQIQDALLAFDLESMNLDATRGISGPAIYAHSLLTDWRKLDPQGFASSPYAKYLKLGISNEEIGQYQRWTTLPKEERGTAAAKMLEAGTNQARSGLVLSMTEDWAKEDPAACREWLASLPAELAEAGARPFAMAAGGSYVESIWKESESFDTSLREGCRIDSHKAWRKDHPEGNPDMNGWSEEAKQAWSDLDALWRVER
ncbi:hypothetical protein [Haloferula sp. BvORR071]|uniref:hypothetical protein n=1 Tax=Haloferula sp. BvORR071 TaxID=1396141 RepID=UPI0005514340|nr:hypothetical protein [Haloferula sp. BvORR071]